jgi:hypothetical protein
MQHEKDCVCLLKHGSFKATENRTNTGAALLPSTCRFIVQNVRYRLRLLVGSRHKYCCLNRCSSEGVGTVIRAMIPSMLHSVSSISEVHRTSHRRDFHEIRAVGA